LNYRHAFHAGNFADLVKHAAVLAVLAQMTKAKAPITVIDTHGGAGAYDLGSEMARKSGEAEAGIGRLMALPMVPEVYQSLVQAVGKLNGGKGLRLYPGSPRLVIEALRPGDHYMVCELRPDDFTLLEQTLKGAKAKVTALMDDGYVMAAQRTPPSGPVLALIDPPFERADDYDRAGAAALVMIQRNPGAVVMVWTPLKDLETFDGFLRRLEQVPGLAEPGFAVGAGIVRAAAMVLQTGLDAGDGGQGLGGMCLVAGGAAEAVDTVEVGPAEAAGGAFAPADRGGDG
jgi:23S rRNA (adenine2030-N6)-methyltransferase